MLCAALALVSICLQGQSSKKNLGLRTVCIDPGHGGKDPGCISRDASKTQEKTLVLDIARNLSELITENCPDVKVIMTRSDDRFIELGERAAKASRGNADLFISLHVNALDVRRNPSGVKVRGFSIHTLGQSKTGRDLYSYNMEACKRENSVIMLESDHSTKYSGFDPSDPESYIFFNLMQNSNLGQSLEFAETVNAEMLKGQLPSKGISQDPFLVLWKTTMPSVLIECGYITNASDLAVLKTASGRKGIAQCIYHAFAAFKKSYDASVSAGTPSKTATELEDKVGSITEKSSSSDAKPENPKSEKKETGLSEEMADNVTMENDANKFSEKKDNDTVNDMMSEKPQFLYGTQILATSKKRSPKDPYFKGNEAIEIFTGKIYKYIIGTSADKNTAFKTHKKLNSTFPEGFFVIIEGENVRICR